MCLRFDQVWAFSLIYVVQGHWFKLGNQGPVSFIVEGLEQFLGVNCDKQIFGQSFLQWLTHRSPEDECVATGCCDIGK